MDPPAGPNARIMPVDTAESFHSAVARAADLLRAGELVGLPTETVYGLAANAFNPAAVARIYEVKGRPERNPIIVHVASEDLALRCVKRWPPLASRLAKAFWPGPLTLILPRSPEIPEIVTAGGATVGVRWPSHPLMQAVIRECGFPLAAPSANLSNRVSPTNAKHVYRQLGQKILLIIDGGQSQIGIESTVLDITQSPPRVLRPGMIHNDALVAITGELFVADKTGTEVLKSPGLLRKHYSPKALLRIHSWKDDREFEEIVRSSRVAPARVHVLVYASIPSSARIGRVSVLPNDPEAFGRALYAELHECDQLGAHLIIVERPPEGPQWAAISDRLRRAAAE